MIDTKPASVFLQYECRGLSEASWLPQTMEKYQRLHQIGQGSFGAVFLVREVETGERLVMKLVNTANIAQSEQQKVKTTVKYNMTGVLIIFNI